MVHFRSAEADLHPSRLFPFPGRLRDANKPYDVPIVKGGQIFQQALARGSGLARRPKFVMPHASGKLEILAVDESFIYLRYHQAKDVQDLGRFLVCRRDDEAWWLDQLEVVREFRAFPPASGGMDA